MLAPSLKTKIAFRGIIMLFSQLVGLASSGGVEIRVLAMGISHSPTLRVAGEWTRY